MLAGCAQKALAPSINDATIRLLTRHDVEVVVPKDAGCCGALTHHMGKEEAAMASARANINAWAALEEQDGGLDAVIINASGCGTTVKDYGFLLREDKVYAEKAARIAGKAKDITELLTELDMPTSGAGNGMRVTYHSACSMQHGQKIKSLPQALLRTAGFTVKDVPKAISAAGRPAPIICCNRRSPPACETGNWPISQRPRRKLSRQAILVVSRRSRRAVLCRLFIRSNCSTGRLEGRSRRRSRTGGRKTPDRKTLDRKPLAEPDQDLIRSYAETNSCGPVRHLPFLAGFSGSDRYKARSVIRGSQVGCVSREARPIERKIWSIWSQHSLDAEINLRFRRGVLLMNAGRLDQAIRVFSTILEADPTFAEAWNKRATLFYLTGDLAGSVRDIERTLALEPRHFGALSGLGLIYKKIESVDGAIKAFSAALEINPHMPRIVEHLDALQELKAGKPL